jgi:hypothetical protein
MTQYLPIIYVRGFAGGTSGIDQAVDDPFYGFNEGSTHVRLGAHGNPRFHQFESPLLRLMIDHGYELMVGGNQGTLLRSADEDKLSPKTIWVYRFYDRSASTFDRTADTHERSAAIHEESPGPFRMEDAALGLVHYIDAVLDKTKDADQVYLVAHSMGGLVCRSAIQRFMYDADQTPTPEEVEAGKGSAPNPADRRISWGWLVPWLLNTGPLHGGETGTSGRASLRPSRRKGVPSGKVPPPFPISKVVTYGAPHGGIDVELGGPIGDWIIETFGPEGSDIFKERRMREYLCPEGQEAFEPRNGWDPRVPYFSALPAERFLSLVGTNPGDYEAALGWSSRAVGVKSDGLVQIRNAYVKGSNRAYIHRSHSGRYGLVNSEEGYQNLQRFLFGNLKVALSLSNLDLDTSNDTVWQADVALAIRQVPVLMHYQSARTHCPVVLNEENLDTPLNPVPLVTAFLLPKKDHPEEPRRYTLDLRVFAVREKEGFVLFGSHIEQVADWQDTLVMDVLTNPDGTIGQALYQWNSTLRGAIADARTLDQKLSWVPAPDDAPATPSWLAQIELPEMARDILGPEASIGIGIAQWR